MPLFQKKSATVGAPGDGNGCLPNWQEDPQYQKILAKVRAGKEGIAPLKAAVEQAQAAEVEARRSFETKELYHLVEKASLEDVQAAREVWLQAKAATEQERKRLDEAERALAPLEQARTMAAEEAQKVTFPKSAKIILERCARVEAAVDELKVAQEELAAAVSVHAKLSDRGRLPSTFSGYIIHPSAFQKTYGPGLLAVGVEELQKVIRRLEKKLGAQG